MGGVARTDAVTGGMWQVASVGDGDGDGCGLIADLLSWLPCHWGNCIRAVNIFETPVDAIKFNHLKTNSRKSTN